MSKQRGRGQGSLFKRSGPSAWAASRYGHDGRRREKSTRTSDRRAAERILAKWVADAAIRREGVIDPKLESIAEESRKPMSWHLDGFEAKMNAAGRKSKHVATTIGYVKRIAKAVGWVQISDISAAGVTKYAESPKERNRSARTIQAHLQAAKSFTRWLTLHERLVRAPLAAVSTPNPNSDRRRERRMLLPDEWSRLERAGYRAPFRYGMSGRERILVYSIAIQTGLRA